MSNAAALRQLIIDRLQDSVPITDLAHARIGGITPETAHLSSSAHRIATRAAVLIPIIERPAGLNVLLTERAAHLRNHGGQISFPAGVSMANSNTVGRSSARDRRRNRFGAGLCAIAGYLESHIIFTGFHVVPVVGFVQPGSSLQPNPKEVADVFEVPLTHLLDSANHGTRVRTVEGGEIHVYNIPCGERVIWGATAGMLMSLYRLLRDPR